MNNFKDFRVAFLHSKFWTHNSLLVPNARVILNEDFVDWHNLLRIPAQIQHFKVFWFAKGISGEICIPGQWNYCYIDGKFYHLVKMHSNGFVKGIEEEWFYYNVIYDDWQNDWMTNSFYLKGTIELTGDQDLVRRHLYQTSPIIENVNGFRFLNGIEGAGDEHRTILKLPKEVPLTMKLEGMSSVDRVNINNELQLFHSKGKLEPVEDRLWIPFMYRISESGNWKGSILNGLKRIVDAGIEVFDVTVESISDAGQAGKFRNILENILGTHELYLASNNDHRVYSFAKSINPTKGISEIDLSECTDITVYDRLRLVPLFSTENPPKKFTVEGFINQIIRKQEWPGDYRAEMIEIFNEVVVPAFTPLIAYDFDWDKKVFRDITIEKIDRDIVDLEDPRGATKNPEWKSWAPTRLVGGLHHKNHIWDNLYKGTTYSAIEGFNSDVKDIGEVLEKEGERLRTEYGKLMDNSPHNVDRIKSSDGRNIFSHRGFYPSSLNNLIYLPDEYKLKCDNCNGYLDFSRNNNENYQGIGLIPDYDRKTHVLAISDQLDISGRLTIDPRDPQSVGRKTEDNKPMYLDPFIMREIEMDEETDVVIDGQKPSAEFLRVYKRLGKDNEHRKNSDGTWDYNYRSRPTKLRDAGAEILCRGYTFYMLNTNIDYSNSKYRLRHHTGSSACNERNYCGYDYAVGGGFYGTAKYADNYKYVYANSYAQRPECVYTSDKREWRRFHTEMTFPVKTDSFNIIDVLREYDDIPDNFLRWEVINTNIKKGKIKAYTRSYVGIWDEAKKARNNNSPGAYRLTKEEEAKIPPNTVVSIFICLRHSGSPEGDAAFDGKAIQDYYQKYKRNGYTRLEELVEKLWELFFVTKGEIGGEYGAIPDWIKRSTTGKEGELYPANGDGRSQLSLSWMKPHQGRGFMAWTRFFAPAIHGENIGFRVLDNKGKLLDLRGSNDWLVAEIPNDYANSGDYYSHNAYRDRVTNVKMNTLLAFYYGGWCPDKWCFDTGPKDQNTSKSDLQTSDQIGNKPFESLPSDKKQPSYHLISNYGGKELWRGADKINEEWIHYLKGWDTLILDNFIRNARTYKSRRLDNPKKIPVKWGGNYQAGGSSVVNVDFSPIDAELPQFMFPYFDLDDKECALHAGEKNTNANDRETRMQLLREKLTGFNRFTLQMLESWNTWIRFDGTNWGASIKLNNKGNQPKWDYELFTNEIATFKTRQERKGNFVNHYEKDVDVLINTRSELSIYGNKFPLKSRMYSEGDVLDVGLHVEPLHDVKQTQAAAWYKVQMNYNEQDILQTFIETPKELTNYSGFSAYEREKLIREIGLRGQEYMYNVQMLDYQKEENKFTNQYEKDGLYKEWKYEVARGATQIVGGVLDVAAGGAGVASTLGNLAWEQAKQYGVENDAGFGIPHGSRANFETVGENPGTFSRGYRGNAVGIPRESGGRKRYFKDVSSNVKEHNMRMGYLGSRSASRSLGGAMGIVGGALTIAEAYETFSIKDEYRKQKYAMAEKKLAAEGDILNKRHEYERKNLLDDLWAMSANVVYPQLNANIVYRLYNESLGINNIHMIQYYPKGKILEYIKEYYKEFGYNIMVRNFECTGVQDVKRHLRYQFIYEINHPNICVQEMIRGRALSGVKVVEWVQ